MNRFIWFILLSLVCVSLHAQDTITLNAVDVTADKIKAEAVQPLVMHRFDSLILETKSTANLSELLIQHSPVFIKTYGPGGVSTASFRGTTASHTLVLWNGFQLNAPTLGQVDFSTIPVFLADDIDLKWGSGTSNNSGGLGGAVNIDNKTSFGKGWNIDLKQTYGSYNTFGSFVTVGYSGKKVAFRVKAYRNSSDNDFEYYNSASLPPGTMKQKNADFVDYGVMPEVSVMLKHGILSISSWNQWNHRNLPQIMTNVLNKNTEEWTSDNFSRNYLAYKLFWDTGKLQLKSAVFIDNQHYFLETHPSNNPDIVVTSINSLNDALVLHQIADVEQKLYNSWKLKGKVQWDREQVNSNNYKDYQVAKSRNMVSSYLAVEGNPFKDADLSVTARYDIVDAKSMGVFPTATFSYHFPMGLGLTLGYSHNYRNPSLNDLYWYPGGNSDLQPENGRTVDLAASYQLNRNGVKLELRTGAYASKVHNWIQWVPTPYRFWMPQNVALVFARGIENHLDFNYTYGDWKASVSGNYVFTFTTDESENAQTYGILGKQLLYIPRHHGNLFSNLRWKTWDLSYTLEVTGLRNTTYANSPFDLPAYVLHHVALGKQWRQFHVELRCNNLTDKDYQNVQWRPMPGRSYEVMVNYRY